MKIIKTMRPAPVSPTGQRSQRSQGTLKVSSRGITSVYPTGPKVAKAASTPRTIIAGAGKTKRSAPANKNNGWTAKVKNNYKTTMLMCDMSAITDRAKREDVHITLLVMKYAPGVVTTEADVHANIKQVIKETREVVGEELAYHWNIEKMTTTGQAHWSITSALTDYEAYVARKAFFKLSGWARGTRLQDVAHITTPSRYEEQTRSSEEILEHFLNYTSLFGESEKAVAKSGQYYLPTGWAETGSGAMWGRSRNLKDSEEVSLVVHNMRQRKAVDRYMSRRLGIAENTICWQYEATGELSDEYNVAPFSPDRHGGSRYAAKITPDILRDLKAIIQYFA